MVWRHAAGGPRSQNFSNFVQRGRSLSLHRGKSIPKLMRNSTDVKNLVAKHSCVPEKGRNSHSAFSCLYIFVVCRSALIPNLLRTTFLDLLFVKMFFIFFLSIRMTYDMASISNKVKFRYFYSIFRQFCRSKLPCEDTN